MWLMGAEESALLGHLMVQLHEKVQGVQVHVLPAPLSLLGLFHSLLVLSLFHMGNINAMQWEGGETVYVKDEDESMTNFCKKSQGILTRGGGGGVVAQDPIRIAVHKPTSHVVLLDQLSGSKVQTLPYPDTYSFLNSAHHVGGYCLCPPRMGLF